MRPIWVVVLALLCLTSLIVLASPAAAQNGGGEVPGGTLPAFLAPVEPGDAASLATPTPYFGDLLSLYCRTFVLFPSAWPLSYRDPASLHARSAVLREPRRADHWVNRGSMARVVQR